MMKTVYQYRGGTITRIDYEDGTKTFRASAGFPKPSPLYNLDELDARPGAPVIIVEGEKAADAAKQLFPDYVVVTSPFGAKSAARTDWSPLLVGRPRVILWRDADDAGIKYAEDVLRHVPDACLVAMNGKFPEGWDLADDVPDGVDLEELLTTASPAASQAKKQAKKNGNADLHKSTEDAKRERDALFNKVRGLRAKTVANGCTEAEAKASADKAQELMDEYNITDDELEFGVSDVAGDDEFDAEAAAREAAAEIVACKDVLGAFEKAWRLSMAGEVKNAKLLYLTCTSRLFDRPMHAAIKGTSAAGKSEIRKRVLKFFPPEAVLSFTMLSERALLYFECDFCHMVLSMGEAAGAEEQTLQDYLLRELMSDGQLRYPVTVKTKDGLATKIIEKNGPVSFLVTTTKYKLHAENETRMLSIEVDDSAVQTSAVLLKIAQTEGLNAGIQDGQYIIWQNFQRWLALGNSRVVVPYAEALAKLIQPKSVRLRRDFTQLLMGIKAHVLIHREHRFENDAGELCANMDDYAAVRELMSDIMAETSETKIKATVLETVDAVRTLQAMAGSEGVTAKAVGKRLRLDTSSAFRRLRGGMDAGLIKNLETRKFQPGLYRTTDVDQDTQELLPTKQELLDGWCGDVKNAVAQPP